MGLRAAVHQCSWRAVTRWLVSCTCFIVLRICYVFIRVFIVCVDILLGTGSRNGDKENSRDRLWCKVIMRPVGAVLDFSPPLLN